MRTLVALLATVAISSVAVTARAGDDDKHTNLKVLQDSGKALENSMKAFSKGIGVKCDACHVKGEFESDKVAVKEDARTFFTAVVGEKDKAKREGALKALLGAMKIEKAKNEAEIWKAVDTFKKK